MNVAEIMRGYTYPTSLEETKEEIPTAYGPSTLQQIAGLGTLIGAVDKSAVGGVLGKILKESGAAAPSGSTDWETFFANNPAYGADTP
jgi:hypothetical protein